MSGAESSRAAAKRRRGPVARPRGEPDQPAPAQRHTRQIEYEEAERVPICSTRRIHEHTLLRFQFGTAEADRLSRFLPLDMLHHRTINWELLDILGQRDRIYGLLGQRWSRVLGCDWPQFRELTLEFHSTFMYDDREFESEDAVSFALGRRVYEMSIPQFAVATGFYSREEVQTPDFMTSLRGATKRDRDYCIGEVDLSEFWSTIADAPFSTSMVESEIRDPVLRYIHRVLACTIVGRYSGEEKVNWIDLFCLYCMVQGREANIACVLAQSFARPRRGGVRARLDMGPYVYCIAASLGVFDRYDPRFMIVGPATSPIDLRDLRRAGIVARDDPPRWEDVRVGHQGLPPFGTAAADAMRASIPTHRQRPVFRRDMPARQYPLRDPVPDPLTLESLCDRMDGYYERGMEFWRTSHEEQRALIQEGQRRQEEALRYMMTSMHIQVPDFFQAPGHPGEQAGDDDED